MANAPPPFGVSALAADTGANFQDTVSSQTEVNGSEFQAKAYGDETKPSTASSVTAGKISELDDGDTGITKDQEHEIVDLARRVSRLSRRSSVYDHDNVVNPFLDAEANPELNPGDKQFKPRKWLKTILQIQSRDPERFPKRTAGVSFRNMNVYGYGTAADYQADVGNTPLKAVGGIKQLLGLGKKVRIDILRNFEGLVKSGEMLVVLGRPGSGCSTFLKTLAGETHGLYLDEGNDIQYQGVSWNQMHKNFRGEVIYQAETETHFPQMTAGDTLYFAARARAPVNRLPGVTRQQYAEHMRDVVMSMLSLSHTMNTKVGNEYIRGVSGGERKRISIAETTLSGSPLQCWDNSTRGLDSSTALEFVKSLRLSTQYSGTTAIVAIYQAGQAIYDIFDKAIVLYEGRQIYFGNAVRAKHYFIEMGFECPDRQTTADFLTSITNPAERRIRPGFQNRVPQTPDEFAERWRKSPERQALLAEIEEYNAEFPLDGAQLEKFQQSRQAEKSKAVRKSSPYTLSFWQQVQLCIWRGFVRLKGDMSMTLTSVIGNIVLSLIISSVFYNQPDNTSSFFGRGSLLFFAILMNGFASSLEILTLWHQRPIVEKHDKYALYHPSAEAISSMIVDLPSKAIVAIVFNLILYFMVNLRRTPGHFFVFFLFSISTTLTMSNIFRTIGAISRTLAQALVPSSIFMLALVIYTGFTIPVRDMRPWFKWISYLNPIQYAFESLMINEFHDRRFPCAMFVPMGPSYANATGDSIICGATGARPGEDFVDGDTFLNITYGYYASHLWRNLGIIFAFFFFFLVTYIGATELIKAKPSKGEILVFPRGKVPSYLKSKKNSDDPESAETVNQKQKLESTGHDQVGAIVKQTSIFHWQDVCYDIKIKNQPRRILNNIDGWVKPGTLTALMGVSGAGKTTLLDVLADRVTMGVVTGEMLVDGRIRDDSFQRKTGYVQQQDLHLEISTVREALVFSALLRQPATTPRAEKIAYVEEVIKMLGMEEYADAVVGVLGEGLNVEQRKRLTIGVEIAAKPDLLLFFDEPTSGLDSQTAWSICTLMRKLADHGQAILCTIHQPSAMLMQEFDRLLFLAAGGKTVYFGELGKNMSTLIDYFENHGSPKCPPNANPAEWMLEVIGAAPGSHTDKDWSQVWNNSPERAEVRRQLAEMKAELSEKPQAPRSAGYGEFAMPFWQQYLVVQHRMFQQYWRSPEYIYSKLCLCIVPTLFIGFTFYKEPTSLQGLQNQMFAIFMFLILFPNLVQQMMPYFVTQRSLYEVRERPSKAYSWKAFMLSSVLVELPWNTLMAVPAFFCWYYPIGFHRNAIASDAVTERSGTMFLLVWIFLMFSSTFSSMIIAGVELAETGGNLAQLLFSLTLIFCGVLATPQAMPRFWIFMYRLSPFTYYVSAVLSTGVANTNVNCSAREFLRLIPPAGQTCGQYLHDYMLLAGGALLNPESTSACDFCPVKDTNTFLEQVNIRYSERWRNIGILFVYIFVNVIGAIGFYWLLRVPKTGLFKKKAKKD
ncbi:pleiotropic drug resistance family protein [Coccidioides immitis RS]|uniref:Pleiotropic drug resistance family protein n=4 Tax=Coccidioides TaxID=5500 RepID=J3KJ62_COCIM|nr:pleiotropic drug resistance family protein [Coccidioides immitis RS]EAS36064.3 pleiotropic drug resistance family protein [Coccidioides immitis RS]KMU92077.1 ABC transporter [Coccidioides immitis H538.4]